MHVITVTFVVKANHVASFHDAVIAQARNSLSQEMRCQQFDVAVDAGDPSRVFLYELYDDEAAFQQHLETAHFKAFDATVGDWLESKNVSAWRRVEPASQVW